MTDIVSHGFRARARPPSSNGPRLRLELLADRQRPNAFPGRCEDRVDQCGREWRHARLTDAAGRHVRIGWHDVDVGDERSLINPDHGEVVEIPLLYLAVLEGDLAISGEREPHDGGALDLRLDPLRIDERSAIDRGVHLGNGELALIVDRYLDDGRDIADKAAMHGNAEPVSFGHSPFPITLVRDVLDHMAKTRGIDRIAVVGLTIVPQVFDRIELNDPRRADQLH